MVMVLAREKRAQCHIFKVRRHLPCFGNILATLLSRAIGSVIRLWLVPIREFLQGTHDAEVQGGGREKRNCGGDQDAGDSAFGSTLSGPGVNVQEAPLTIELLLRITTTRVDFSLNYHSMPRIVLRMIRNLNHIVFGMFFRRSAFPPVGIYTGSHSTVVYPY